jgi:putative copper export protein
MSVSEMLLQTFLRWLDFVGLTTLVGGLAFRCLVVRPALLSRQEIESFEGRLRRAEAGSIVLVALASLGDLLLRTLMMSEGTLADLGTALPAVLSQTHFGTVWIVRISLIGLLGGSWLLRRGGTPRLHWSAGASLVGATLVALTTSLTGHAADWGDLTVPVLVDWFHLLAVSAWTGGLFTLGFVLRGSLGPPGSGEKVQGLASIALRFSRMAACCAAGFLAAGCYNAWIQVTSIWPLFTTSYGWTLLVKLSLVLLVLMIAALNRYYFLSRLGGSSFARDRLIVRTIGRLAGTLPTDKGSKDEEKIQQQFFRSVRLEWLVAVGALACTALLTQLPPARHIRSHQHLEQHATHQPVQGMTTPRWSLAGKQQGGKFPLDRVGRPW